MAWRAVASNHPEAKLLDKTSLRLPRGPERAVDVVAIPRGVARDAIKMWVPAAVEILDVVAVDLAGSGQEAKTAGNDPLSMASYRFHAAKIRR